MGKGQRRRGSVARGGPGLGDSGRTNNPSSESPLNTLLSELRCRRSAPFPDLKPRITIHLL